MNGFLTLLGEIYGIGEDLFDQAISPNVRAGLRGLITSLRSAIWWIVGGMAGALFLSWLTGYAFVFCMLGIVLIFVGIGRSLTGNHVRWALIGLSVSDVVWSRLDNQVNLTDLRLARTYLGLLRLMLVGSCLLLLFFAFFGGGERAGLALGVSVAFMLLAVMSIPGLTGVATKPIAVLLVLGVGIMAFFMVMGTLKQPSKGEQIQSKAAEGLIVAEPLTAVRLIDQNGKYTGTVIPDNQQVQITGEEVETNYGEPMVRVRVADEEGNFSRQSQEGLLPASKLNTLTPAQYKSRIRRKTRTNKNLLINQPAKVKTHYTANGTNGTLYFFWKNLKTGSLDQTPRWTLEPNNAGRKHWQEVRPSDEVLVKNAAGQLIYTITYENADQNINIINQGGQIQAVPM